MSLLATVHSNLAGFLEAPEFGATPYAIDVDGRPFIPVGDGGVVLDLRLGDRVFGADGEHAAPGATLTHPDQPARHALTAFACLGNEVVLRSGAAAGASGRVLGKRGEAGRVVVVFDDDVLARLAPGDAVMVRAGGQGSTLPAQLHAAGAIIVNAEPEALARLGIEGVTEPEAGRLGVPVRGVLGSRIIGNGLGRPVQMWDVDLTVTAATAERWQLTDLRIGDLVAVNDLDVRHNIGFRRGWTTVGVIVHGASRLPGHGPGLMPVLCGPGELVELSVDVGGHTGVTRDRLGFDRA
jgi:hypothetical protein